MVRHQWARAAMPCCINRNPGLRGRIALRSRFPVADPAAAARLQFKSASPFNSHIPFLAPDPGACMALHGNFQLVQTSWGFNAMENNSIGLELTEEEILFFRISDEALEIVACAAKQMTNFSIGYCSALSVCDG
jgi:hypothetical protein